MQTFLPLPDFYESAACLDIRRLGKQRVEAMQILHILEGRGKGWANHPAVGMWRGYTQALCAYGIAICEEWQSRGCFDTAIEQFLQGLEPFGDWSDACLPVWFGNDDFHASHRSNLLRKDPKHYGQFGWLEGPDLPYVWPKPMET